MSVAWIRCLEKRFMFGNSLAHIQGEQFPIGTGPILQQKNYFPFTPCEMVGFKKNAKKTLIFYNNAMAKIERGHPGSSCKNIAKTVRKMQRKPQTQSAVIYYFCKVLHIFC